MSRRRVEYPPGLLSPPPHQNEMESQVRREVLAAVGPDGYVDCGGNGGEDKEKGKQRKRRLPMVDACIRESQRLYPVAPFVVRHLRSDLRLKDGEEGGLRSRSGRSLLPCVGVTCVCVCARCVCFPAWSLFCFHGGLHSICRWEGMGWDGMVETDMTSRPSFSRLAAKELSKRRNTRPARGGGPQTFALVYCSAHAVSGCVLQCSRGADVNLSRNARPRGRHESSLARSGRLYFCRGAVQL